MKRPILAALFLWPAVGHAGPQALSASAAVSPSSPVAAERLVEPGMPASASGQRAAALTLSAAAPTTAAGPVASGPLPGPSPSTAPYRVLDNVEGPHIDLGIPAFRPMVVTPDLEHLYALNVHDSTVVHYDRSLTLQDTFRAPWGPVSIALWQPPGGAAPELVVVSRGTSALTRLDRATGAILGMVELPAEPADLLIDDASGLAWVACAGADSVVAVDLSALTVAATVPIESKQPAFLARDGDRLLVAPQISGNNTTVDPGGLLLAAGDEGILDLSGAALGLPDDDLFAIDLTTFAVEVVSRGAGTLLNAHGVNPATGEHWQLGTDALNFGPFGEPALKGDFIVNQVTLTTLPAPGGPPATSHATLGLDGPPLPDGLSVAQPWPQGLAEAAGQPYALDFSARGDAFIAGLITDNVTWLAADGGLVQQLEVCSLPRAVTVIDSGGAPGILLVYCWGSNEIEGWNVKVDVPFVGFTLDLGRDPLSADAQRGRAHFFDGENSARGNAACASCHLEGHADGIAWDLGNLPFDDKGPLITQTLKGIEPLNPYHWRGERADLIDFNGAFHGLLGGMELDERAFADLQLYVFGLQNRANPRQDPRRVVSADLDDIGGYPGIDPSAVAGQDLFFDQPVVVGRSCDGCHTLPLGTDNDMFNDEGGHTLAPKRSHFKVAPFHALWRKEQPSLVTIDHGEGPDVVPTLGTGTSATGLTDSLADFVNLDPFNLDDQGRADITAFVHQHDAGLAPAVHRGRLLDAGTAAAVGPEVLGYFIPQAAARNCDLVAVGSTTLPSGAAAAAWFFDRGDGLFHADSTLIPPQSPQALIDLAAGGHARLMVLGLPVGMGRPFAADADDDLLLNADEDRLGTDPLDPDSDGDDLPDGFEVAGGGDPLDALSAPQDSAPPVISALRLVYATTRVAKIAFDTDEAATWRVRFQEPGGHSGVVRGSAPGTNHTALLRELRPGRSYAVTVTAADALGNAVTVALSGGVDTLDVLTPQDVIVRDLSAQNVSASGDALSLDLVASAAFKSEAPAPGFQLAADVYVNGAYRDTPFQSTVSGDDGLTTLPISVGALSAGDEIRVVVWSLYTFSDTGALQTTRWSFPDTPPDARELTLVF